MNIWNYEPKKAIRQQINSTFWIKKYFNRSSVELWSSYKFYICMSKVRSVYVKMLPETWHLISVWFLGRIFNPLPGRDDIFHRQNAKTHNAPYFPNHTQN